MGAPWARAVPSAASTAVGHPRASRARVSPAPAPGSFAPIGRPAPASRREVFGWAPRRVRLAGAFARARTGPARAGSRRRGIRGSAASFAAADGDPGSFSPDPGASSASLSDASASASASAPASKDASLSQTLAVFSIELGLMAMGVVDTAMVGHVGEASLAAASLGGIATWLVIVTAMGFVGGLDPLTSQAHGSEDDAAVARWLRAGVRASFILALLGSLAMLAAEPSFLFFGQPSAHAAAAARYCRVEAFGILPVLLFQTCRLSLQGTDAFAPLVRAVLVANALNVAMNRALIDGVAALGVPAMGLDGAAWATVCSRWSLLILVLAFAKDRLGGRFLRGMRLGGHLLDGNEEHIHRDEKHVPRHHLAPRRGHHSHVFRALLFSARGWSRAFTLLRHGASIGAQMFVEFGAFAAMSLMAGRCGSTEAAAHAVAQCLTDVSYVVPLGVGALGSVKVGQNVGAGDQSAATEAARTSLKRGAIGVALNALVFVCFGTQLCGFFTDDPSVIRTAATLAPTLAAYQAFDGLRVVGAGCLRGVGRLRAALVSDVIGFWVVGVPLGYWLASGGSAAPGPFACFDALLGGGGGARGGSGRGSRRAWGSSPRPSSRRHGRWGRGRRNRSWRRGRGERESGTGGVRGGRRARKRGEARRGEAKAVSSFITTVKNSLVASSTSCDSRLHF